MSRIPSARPSWLKRQKWLLEFVVQVVVLCGASVFAHRAWTEYARDTANAIQNNLPEPSSVGVWAAIAVCLLSLVAAILRVMFARDDNAAQLARSNPADLLGCCMVLRATFAEGHSAGDPNGFRVAVYRVIKSPNGTLEELECVTPYAVGPGGQTGSAGKRVSAKNGVIGLAARTGDPQVAHRQSEDTIAFRKEMVEEWGFDETEAKGLNDSRYSWLAIPIKGVDGIVDSVVYFDSSARQCFTEEACRPIFRACEGVAEYIGRRYGDGG